MHVMASLFNLCANFLLSPISFFFFFNDTATTEIYTLSLHDALPISGAGHLHHDIARLEGDQGRAAQGDEDRKSTRLNSSHLVISYAVFCLKKKKHRYPHTTGSHDTQSSSDYPRGSCL